MRQIKKKTKRNHRTMLEYYWLMYLPVRIPSYVCVYACENIHTCIHNYHVIYLSTHTLTKYVSSEINPFFEGKLYTPACKNIEIINFIIILWHFSFISKYSLFISRHSVFENSYAFVCISHLKVKETVCSTKYSANYSIIYVNPIK